MQQIMPQAPVDQLSAHQSFDAVIPLPKGTLDLEGEVGLGIRTSSTGISQIDYLQFPVYFRPENALAAEAVRQLERYFDDPRWRFDLPLDLQGTDFQQRLWRALLEIPSGQVATYGELARRLNSGAQAVGQACRRNPVPVIVPCHRVLSQHGAGGYAGAVDGQKLQIKLGLLRHEGLEPVSPHHPH